MSYSVWLQRKWAPVASRDRCCRVGEEDGRGTAGDKKKKSLREGRRGWSTDLSWDRLLLMTASGAGQGLHRGGRGWERQGSHKKQRRSSGYEAKGSRCLVLGGDHAATVGPNANDRVAGGKRLEQQDHTTTKVVEVGFRVGGYCNKGGRRGSGRGSSDKAVVHGRGLGLRWWR
ncbi:hypothetical protein BHM03_00025740 [Ensete ventricosum]|nr:hypothetical protein BHM03_00025740 [Ensete ventricosum]